MESGAGLVLSKITLLLLSLRPVDGMNQLTDCLCLLSRDIQMERKTQLP